MKRFWKAVAAEPQAKGWTIDLDGRPIRTPGHALLLVPTLALADAIAGEWRGVDQTLDPRTMPFTGLANAAVDRVIPDREAFAKGLARYADADLACYRAQGPRGLVALQEQEWDRLLLWARRRYDVDFETTAGLIHVAQPPATIERLRHAVTAIDAFRLTGLAPLVTIGGSLVAGLAILEKAIPPEEAWNAVSLDERWQLQQWGSDAEAAIALENRRRDFLSAARFLDLLD